MSKNPSTDDAITAPLPDDQIERALVITAHPDDLDFGAGGTIAQWTARGISVSYCICTDGDQGGFDPAEPRENIPGIRQREQRAAGEVLGVSEITFLGYRDGWLTPSFELRKDLVRAIRRARPQRVLIQSPERNWTRIQASHPDHLAAGEAAIQAIYPDARNAFAWPELLSDEGLEPWTVREVWVMAIENPTHFVDISSTFDQKIAALRAHASQTAHESELESWIREWAERNARAAGWDSGLAEAFKIVATE
jgi:LmbE family N-acetylglucosaminyl deacetylase